MTAPAALSGPTRGEEGSASGAQAPASGQGSEGEHGPVSLAVALRGGVPGDACTVTGEDTQPQTQLRSPWELQDAGMSLGGRGAGRSRRAWARSSHRRSSAVCPEPRLCSRAWRQRQRGSPPPTPQPREALSSCGSGLWSRCPAGPAAAPPRCVGPRGFSVNDSTDTSHPSGGLCVSQFRR